MKPRHPRCECLKPAGVVMSLGMPAGYGSFETYLAFVVKILASPGLVDVGLDLRYEIRVPSEYVNLVLICGWGLL